MFHEHCGRGVILSDDKTTAERADNEASRIVLSKESLTRNQPFTIKIEGTFQKGKVPLCMGVTHQDPKTEPYLPDRACEMEESWCVSGKQRWVDGVEAGEQKILVAAEDKAGIIWDGQAVSIIINEATNLVFNNIDGPVWALTQVFPMTKISVVTQESKAVESTKMPVPTKKEEPIHVVSPSILLRRPDFPISGARRIHRKVESIPVRESLAGDMDEMSLGEVLPRRRGASAGVTPRKNRSITCNYWKICARFIDYLKLADIFFDTQFDICFCEECMTAREDGLYYKRGNPLKTYGLPSGWCRFGLSVPAKAKAMDVFSDWHVGYHGTRPMNIRTILESDLLMPGDYTLQGKRLAPPSGHFTETRKPEDFDIKQVFVSPTIAYAGHPAYAEPQKWTDLKTGRVHDMQVALQVRIKPDSYQVGKETLGIGSKILDAAFDNSELEWSTKIRGAIILQGILVKSS